MTGQDIRDFRVKHNMTQKQLAEMIGSTQREISAYEREEKLIPEAMAKKITLCDLVEDCPKTMRTSLAIKLAITMWFIGAIMAASLVIAYNYTEFWR